MREAGQERAGSGCFKGRGGEIMQQYSIFRNRKKELVGEKGREPGMQGTGVGRFGPPIPQIDSE